MVTFLLLLLLPVLTVDAQTPSITGIEHADSTEPGVEAFAPEILPGIINVSAGHWTFLVTGMPISETSRLVVTLGDSAYEGVRTLTTTDTSSLWEVHYPALDEPDSARVSVLADDGGATPIITERELEQTADPRDADSLLALGEVAATLIAGRLAYIPGQQERALAELEGGDPTLFRMLRELGVTTVGKYASRLADTTTWVTRRGLPHRMRSPAIRTYRFQIGVMHNPSAIARILAETPGVEKAVPYRTDDVWDGGDFLFPPEPISTIQPINPLPGVVGLVVLDVCIEVDGSVSDARVATSEVPPECEAAAMEAILKWRFEPAREHGVPVASRVQVPISFGDPP